MTSIRLNKKSGIPSNVFVEAIWSQYDKYRREFPWRNLDWKSAAPEALRDRTYKVVVSEIMLQQTQAPRVVPRYGRFIARFPDWQSLAQASTADVLVEWQGLGYNRRALYLKRIAELIASPQKSSSQSAGLPSTFEELRELPGIGPNTAGSILAFAFNIAHPFIETNIRSVYIHFFFAKHTRKITDIEILKLIAEHLTPTKANLRAHKNPREWYYALMDYGAMLKQQAKNGERTDPARKSKHHVKQSTFKGSNRELRAELLRSILKQPNQTAEQLTASHIAKNNSHRTPANILKNLQALTKEGFIEESGRMYFIKK
jgi:A/G-specific adenine glycosylase